MASSPWRVGITLIAVKETIKLCRYFAEFKYFHYFCTVIPQIVGNELLALIYWFGSIYKI